MKNKWMGAMQLLLVTAVIFGGLSAVNTEKLHAAPKAENQAVVNINKAGLEELQSIRGVGPSLAQRILDYRAEYGSFESIEDLSNVRGIGAGKLDKMKSQISVK